jgi:hypothetical protein
MYLDVVSSGGLASRGRGFGAAPATRRPVSFLVPWLVPARRRLRSVKRVTGFGALTADQLNGLAPIPITDPVYGTTQLLYRDPASGTMLPLGAQVSPTGGYTCDTSNPASQCYNLPGSPYGWAGPSTPVPFIGGSKTRSSFSYSSGPTEPTVPLESGAPAAPPPAPAPPPAYPPLQVDTPQASTPIYPGSPVAPSSPVAVPPGSFDVSAPVNVAGVSFPLWALLAAGGAALYFFGGRK